MSWSTSEVRALNWFNPSGKIFLLTVLRWTIYVISVLYCYAFMHVCLLMHCGHLLGKGWPLGSRIGCLIVTLSLSHYYPGSGVVLVIFALFLISNNPMEATILNILTSCIFWKADKISNSKLDRFINHLRSTEESIKCKQVTMNSRNLVIPFLHI